MDTLFVRSYGLFDPGPLLRLSHHRPPGGGEQLKVPVSHVLRRPTRPVFYGEHKRTADVGLRACATMQSHGFVSPPSHPFLFFEQNRQAAAIRHRAIPFHRLLPRHFVSGPSVSPAPPGPAGRPGHFTSPTSSFYKSSSSTPSFVILFYMDTWNMSIRGRGPHGLPTSFPSA